MLFGCARCLTSTFGSLYFFLARVTTVSIWAPSKIVILDGARTWQSHHLFSFWRYTTRNGRVLVVAMALFGNKSVPRTLGSIEFFLLQVNTIWTPWKIIILDGAQRCLTKTVVSISFSFDSGQSCVDLSPIENNNFRWGPNFIELSSSLVLMFQTF